MTDVVVVGTGMAGVRAAEVLRQEGFTGTLTLIGAEDCGPYDRPPLSKQVLTGKSDVTDIALLDAATRTGLKATWLTGMHATAFDAGARTVRTSDGRRLTADGLVVATGTRARRLPAAEGWAGVHHLRTFSDARALRDALGVSHRVVVVGGGFIGAEVASVARSLGKAVAMVEVERLPLQRQLGPAAAELLLQLHLRHGVEVVSGTGVEHFDGDHRVREVVLTDGSRLPADLVVVGIGAEPNTEWLTESGIECDNGVLTDEWCRTTIARVVAAGDVAAYRTRTGRLRIEHWTNARDMAAAAARSLLTELAGADVTELPRYDPLPYVWSDQYDRHIQIAGRPAGDDEFDIVGGSVAESFLAVYRRNHAITGVLAVDSPKEFGRIRRELRTRWASR